MPKIPQLEGPSVQERAQPLVKVGVDAPIEAFGGGQAAAQTYEKAGQLVTNVAKVYADEVYKADQAIASNKASGLYALQNELEYGKDGAYRARGENALGIGKKKVEEFDKQAAEIEATLKNDNQRALFQAERAKVKKSFEDGLIKHENKEFLSYQDQATTSAIAVQRTAASLNWADPDRIAQHLTQQDELVFQRATQQGLGGDTAKNMVLAERSKTNRSIVESMLSNPGMESRADEYVKANEGNGFTEDDLRIVKKDLMTGLARQQSQKLADEITGKAKTFSEARELFKSLPTEYREDTQRKVEEYYDDAEKAKKQVQDNAFQNAYNIISKNPKEEAIPPSTWNSLEPKDQEVLRRIIKDGGKEPAPNGVKYYDIRLMASNPATQAKFKSMDLPKLQGLVTNAELKELIGLQADANKGGTALNGVMSDAQIINTTLKAAGLDANAKAGTSEYNEYIGVWRAIGTRVNSEQEKLGRKLNDNEIQAVADRETIRLRTATSFFGDTKKFPYQVAAGDVINVPFAEIPRADRKQISVVLARKGLPVTEVNIQKMFNQDLGMSAVADE